MHVATDVFVDVGDAYRLPIDVSEILPFPTPRRHAPLRFARVSLATLNRVIKKSKSEIPNFG